MTRSLSIFSSGQIYSITSHIYLRTKPPYGERALELNNIISSAWLVTEKSSTNTIQSLIAKLVFQFLQRDNIGLVEMGFIYIWSEIVSHVSWLAIALSCSHKFIHVLALLHESYKKYPKYCGICRGNFPIWDILGPFTLRAIFGTVRIKLVRMKFGPSI